MDLNPIVQKYILHWGEMGTRWGVNRTVAQIHALLYLSEEPMNADEIVETLNIARSNVSTSIKELQNWGLVKVEHKLGDRRDHFIALQDVWEMFTVIVSERKRRELDPTLTVLRDCTMDAENDPKVSPVVRKKLTEVMSFAELITDYTNDMRKLSPQTLKTLFKMGSKIQKFLPKKN